MLPEAGLRHSALLLGVAGAAEFCLQMLVPVILVRCLDQTAFGQYRLLWLLANTALAIAPAFMPQSLFYFLPRAQPAARGLVIGNVVLYCTLAGSVAGIVASGWNPWMTDAARDLFFQTHGLSSLFLGLWIVASVVDVLPTAAGQARWQAGAIIAFALLRTSLLLAAALLSPDIIRVGIAMLCLALAKVATLGWYLCRKRDFGRIGWQLAALRSQLAYAIPFALGNAMFLLRAQGDQWIVISMTTPALYAAFSVASVVQPVAALIRQPVVSAMMPHLNAAHARGDTREIARLIARSSGAAGMLLLPITGALLATSPTLIETLYTSRYAQAVPVMQIYLFGMAISTIAVGHVLSAIGKGGFAARSSFWCLLLSLVLSIAGLHFFGLPGAALGSVLTLVISELWALQTIAVALGVPMRNLVAWRALLPAVTGTVCAIAATMAAARELRLDGISLLLVEGVLYLLTFGAAFLLAGGRRQFDLMIGWRLQKKTVAPT
ncbi:MAG: polysaccharide biosynthesis protein [Herminiimonas sp.]|nr:polysaccharide biosynthesis protein [Herminiimonas sp.]